MQEQNHKTLLQLNPSGANSSRNIRVVPFDSPQLIAFCARAYPL